MCELKCKSPHPSLPLDRVSLTLTDRCAILSHNALHRSDDLLHHRRRHGGGVDRAVGMGAQVLDELLNPAETRETRKKSLNHSTITTAWLTLLFHYRLYENLNK